MPLAYQAGKKNGDNVMRGGKLNSGTRKAKEAIQETGTLNGKAKKATKGGQEAIGTQAYSGIKKGSGGGKETIVDIVGLQRSGSQESIGGQRGRGGRGGASGSHESRVRALKKINESELDVTDEEDEIDQLKKNKTSRTISVVTTEKNMEIDLLRTQLKEAEERHDKELSDLRKETRQTILLKEQKLQEITELNDELRTRLSAHFGAKLQDNNPHIADLSDPNRPTKIADQFSSLYDDEWTNSFEVITKKANCRDEKAVSLLLNACVEIYKYCIKVASKELDELRGILAVFNSESDVTLLKQLKDRRKKNLSDERLKQDFEPQMTEIFDKELRSHKEIENSIANV